MRRGFVRFLILEAALLAMFGALLILNPEFATTRWPWELNPMDSIIVAAWFVGWAVWCGTMAFANDWRDVRAAAYLNMIAGAGILAASLASLSLFNSARTGGYLITLATLTVLMAVFTWRQERSTA